MILPDLPAHGARFQETPLTLDNAVSTLQEVITKESQGQKASSSSSSSRPCAELVQQAAVSSSTLTFLLCMNYMWQ